MFLVLRAQYTLWMRGVGPRNETKEAIIEIHPYYCFLEIILFSWDVSWITHAHAQRKMENEGRCAYYIVFLVFLSFTEEKE